MISSIRFIKNRGNNLLIKPNFTTISQSLSTKSLKSSSFIISNNTHNSKKFNKFIVSIDNSFNNKRFYSKSNNNSNNNDNKNNENKKDNLDEHLFHDKDEFSKDPKFFYIVTFVVIGGLIFNFAVNHLLFSTNDILEDIKSVLNSDDALVRNNYLKLISSRASQVFCIENLFKLGVVEVFVKSLNDPDPIVQLTAIKTLDKFSNGFHYEVFGDEAVKKGACQALARIMLSNGMNSDAASVLWLKLFLSKNNQIQLLASNELLYCLQTLAYSDNLEFQRVSIATIKILFGNRDVYPMLLKLKGMLNRLHKSQDILISNHAEYFLSVLKGELIPPVGDLSFNFEDLNIGHNIHTAFNLLMVPFTYLYCSLRWRRHSRDSIYWRTKGFYGSGMLLIASTITTLLSYPDFYPNILNERLKKNFSLSSKTIEEFDRCKEQLQSSAVLLVDQSESNNSNNNNNNNISSSKNNNNDKEKSGGFKENVLFTPNSLYIMKQASPILTYFFLLLGWKHARYIVLPSVIFLLQNTNTRLIRVKIPKQIEQ